MTLGGFDEGFAQPGQAAIYLDFELSLRAWIRGFTVASLAVAARRPQHFVTPLPAKLSKRHELSVLRTNKTLRNTTVWRRADGTEEILDENGEPINAWRAASPRFRAFNAIRRPKVAQYTEAVWALYRPLFDNISERVWLLNRASVLHD